MTTVAVTDMWSFEPGDVVRHVNSGPAQRVMVERETSVPRISPERMCLTTEEAFIVQQWFALTPAEDQADDDLRARFYVFLERYGEDEVAP